MQTLLIVAGVLFVIMLIAMFFVRKATQNRLESLLPPGKEPTMEDVKSIAKSGDKICAIRVYRQIYGVGLKEAKDAVEKLSN